MAGPGEIDTSISTIIELSDDELEVVSAGKKSDAFTKFGDIEGETTTASSRTDRVQML